MEGGVNTRVKKRTSQNGGHYWTQMPGCFRVTLPEITEMVREGDVEFEGGSEVETLFACLRSAEPANGDVKLLGRIIRAGGLIAYAKDLEESI